MATAQVQQQRTPLDTSEINAKIENGQVKVKTLKNKTAKSQQPTGEKAKATKRKAPSDEAFLETLKQLHSKTGKAVTSREISDAVGIKDSDFGRGAVRSAMRRLQSQGKVNIEIQSEGKVKFRYTPK